MLAIRIALRYFAAPKSRAAVNVIAFVAVAGIAVATAAIIIILSVFNGFTALTRSHFSAVDAPLVAVPLSGRPFPDADSIAALARAVPGVAAALPTLESRGILLADDDRLQIPVVFKGVPDDYPDVVDLEPSTEYVRSEPVPSGFYPATVAIGVASRLGMGRFDYPTLYTVRRLGRVNPANPASAFFSAPLAVERVVSVDQAEFDADHIFIPLSLARQLLQYSRSEASAIEISLSPGASPARVSDALAAALPAFEIRDRDRRHSEAFRMIAVEKWVTFAMLIFILVIAGFNILSTLSLMVIEKRSNMATLRALGASRSLARGVFAAVGALVTAVGGLAGILLGLVLALAQQWGGFIKLGGNPDLLSTDAYPVVVAVPDILAVIALIIAAAAVAAAAGSLISRQST